VDDAPELRLDVAFQKRHPGKVWLAQYVDSKDAPMAMWQKGKGIVKIERTKGLDEASAKIMLMIDMLPADWENVPEIVEHLTANMRAKKVLEDGSTVYHFPHTGKPDHLHHAKCYCEVALSTLPPAPAEEECPEDDLPATGKERYTMPGSMRGRL